MAAFLLIAAVVALGATASAPRRAGASLLVCVRDDTSLRVSAVERAYQVLRGGYAVGPLGVVGHPHGERG